MHWILQGEGSEQGDALIFLCSSPWVSTVRLKQPVSQLWPGQRIFDFLDDIYRVTMPERVDAVCAIVEEQLHVRTRIRIHGSKTKVSPCCCSSIARLTQTHDENIWQCLGCSQEVSHVGAHIGVLGPQKCRPYASARFLGKLGRWFSNDFGETSSSCRPIAQPARGARCQGLGPPGGGSRGVCPALLEGVGAWSKT